VRVLRFAAAEHEKLIEASKQPPEFDRPALI
jgi:hypothetical protein